MESWVYYAVLAAVFIAVRDVFGKRISQRYSFVQYLGYASIIVAVCTWIYIFAADVKMKPLNMEYLGLILIRLLIVYIIIEPSLYFCINNCKNLGEASAIINMNVLFAFIISCYLYKTPIDIRKVMGILLVIGGSYFIVQ